MLPYMTLRRMLLRFVGMLGNRPVDDAAIHYIEKAVVEEIGGGGALGDHEKT